jgi:hypothetical protein
MKTYPSIPHYSNNGTLKRRNQRCFGFDKKDGSNVRVEFNKKLSKKSNFTHGFKKFGTRNRLLDPNSMFGPAIDIFYEKYAEGLERVFTDNQEYKQIRMITVYLEFFGKNSFAGLHEDTDEKDLVLIDVFKFQKGFVAPKNFINDFSELGIPEVVYEGIYDEEFINDVRMNKFNLDEGVVAKGVEKVKGKDNIWMVKIKTNKWLNKVKDKLGQKALLLEVNNDQSIIETL